MINALYSIFIYPLYQIIEVCYVVIFKLFKNPGLSIIGVSAAVTLFCLPLYVVAERWQQTERDTQNKLKPTINRIKAVFKGDEQYMILSAYYRQNHYHPMMALRSSFGLLIQIPFFMAAFSFLSNNEAVQGFSFFFIRDLGMPDRMLSIGGFTVNVLPIAMTVINCIAGAIYTKGFPAKEKIQIYGMALVFLVLLYNSPAGLVLYWTMNNVFSLIKNIFYKLKNPLKALYVLLCICVTAMNIYLLFIGTGMFSKRILMVTVISIVYLAPLLLKLLRYAFKTVFAGLVEDSARRTRLFFLMCVSCTLLTGFVLPSLVIASSPQEFSFIDAYTNPMAFIFNTFFQSMGFCFVWPLCIYFLFSKKIQTMLTVLATVCGFSAVCNAFLFPSNYGTISITFTFTDPALLNAGGVLDLINIFVLILVAVLLLVLFKINKIKIVSTAAGIICVVFAAVSVYNSVVINRDFKEYEEIRQSSGIVEREIKPLFNLSKDKQNVVVVMLDGTVNGFVKYIFEETPELYRQFDGFTLFPNTISFGGHTHMGAPPIWGGYEYSPKGMNTRPNETMKDKHNEALLVLPTILVKNGFDVTVTDPSWSNYSFKSDIRPYAGKEGITAYNTIGNFTSVWYQEHGFSETEVTSSAIRRNTIFFSFLKQMPVILRFFVYDQGKYWNSNDTQNSQKGFIDNYAVLDYLPRLTTYTSAKSSAVLITNESPHSPILLQYPEYIPVPEVTQLGSGEYAKNRYYHGTVAALRALGRWFDALKANGVYDNTRIIIVADHGGSSNAHIADEELDIPGERREKYNPILMEKDFGAHGSLVTDMTFMTNGDVPLMVLAGIDEHPVNPFTGNLLTSGGKEDGVWITINHAWEPEKHNKNTFKIKDDEWVFVHDNIFDKNNWSRAK
ncbi:YidC/Oxa1 family membrane protein insertase [Breznakiella homolactica]|uniref:YidC/Oxa1 family membrane protein insertase n=1 Tax=Breznakiella homolactica TaxID=2798577 RepID=A0A7T7XNY0_9SPIR|nr:YidC/Oxa1 family membrane protein insertase [Breznakiella homolactica]QQO09796.1 YidC/Oxa1 family membrane protein insertase [Breznakiella homolactica]